MFKTRMQHRCIDNEPSSSERDSDTFKSIVKSVSYQSNMFSNDWNGWELCIQISCTWTVNKEERETRTPYQVTRRVSVSETTILYMLLCAVTVVCSLSICNKMWIALISISVISIEQEEMIDTRP